MKLSKLDGELLWKVDGKSYFESDCPSLAQAQGLMFLCPKCFAVDKNMASTHRIVVWFKDRGIPLSLSPAQGRWTPSGIGLDNVTLIDPQPIYSKECKWAGYIQNGEAVDA